MRFRLLVRGIALVTLAITAPVQAQDSGQYDRFNDRFGFYIGAFFAETDSTITINALGITPPPIDFEDILGLEDSDTTGWGGAWWQISRRNSVEFEYFQLNRSGFIDLLGGETIEIEDFLIESGTLDTTYDFSIARLTYGFSFIRNERTNAKIKAGLHIADMEATILLSGAICDLSAGDTPGMCPVQQTDTAQQDVTAPLPHLGASYAYALSPNWSIDAQLLGFAIELDNIDGNLIEADFNVNWHFAPKFDAGLGLRYFKAEVKSTSEELNGKFEFEYWGPVLMIGMAF